MLIPTSVWEAFIHFAGLRIAGGKEVSINSTTPDGPRITAPYPKNNLDEKIGDVAAWECAFLYGCEYAAQNGYADEKTLAAIMKTAKDVYLHNERCRKYNNTATVLLSRLSDAQKRSAILIIEGESEPPVMSASLMSAEAEAMVHCRLLNEVFNEVGITE